MAGKDRAAEWLTEDGLIRIESWARDGLTDKQIAAEIGVSESAFTRWKKKHPPILGALKKGKRPLDFQVENALLKRALGYETLEVTVIEAPDGSVTRKETKKSIAPDVTAQIFWLKNRKTKLWRDRRDPVPEADERQDDGFIDALAGTAATDWAGDADGEE